jgi:hypothetical protein
MADVMFDPSVLLLARLDRVTDVVRRLRSEGATPYVPATFYGLVRESELSVATFDALHGRRTLRGPEHIGYQNDRRELMMRAEIDAVQNWIATTDVTPYEPALNELEMRAADIELRAENPEVGRILMEEWSFLQTRSIVGSRIKKPFNAFIRGGAVAVEGGRRRLHRLETRTLRLDPVTNAELRLMQHLRAVAKWIAAGGASASALIEPLLGVAVGAGAGWFLLLDP